MTGHDALTLDPEFPPPAAGGAGVREIGSDFELVEDRYLGPDTAAPLPWEAGINVAGINAAGITYLESGRQALALAETELRRQGHRDLHVPSYLCDTMIAPFHRNGWSLRQLPVDSDVAVSPADLIARVIAGVLLHAPYFGRQDSPEMLAALHTLRRRGVVVIVDETHRLFSGPSQVADLRVASLRKLLPLYDGGYVTGLPGQPPASWPAPGVSLAASEIADLRQLASVYKTSALASRGRNDIHLAAFARAGQATARRAEPAPMSIKSRGLLRHLDLPGLRATRAANAHLLAAALGHNDRFRIVNPPAPDLLPSHLVLDTDDVSGLRRHLTGQRIFCPVHWPPSELLPRQQDWPGRYLSLPVDHRYAAPDMLRIAAEVSSYFAGGQRR